MLDHGEAAVDPAFECDLVMKGGVTSGIIYPAAIAAIARDYRLRAVGGTSAGAIGAAAAAAMEFGRRSGRNPAAPAMMASLATELGTQGADGSPLLLRLFEPDPATARLFALLMRLAGRQRSAAAMLWPLLRGPAMVALVVAGALTAALGRAAAGAPLGLAAAMLVLLFGLPALTALFAALYWLPRMKADLAAVAANGFGFCSGLARHRPEERRRRGRRPRAARSLPSLAEWLHGHFQALGGLDADEVLTFGDLWTAADRAGGVSRAVAFEAATGRVAVPGRPPPHLSEIGRDIDLALVASDINRGQSVQLPFMRREDRLYARISDLGALFPAAIVNWMVDHRRTGDAIDAELASLVADPADRADFIRLPRPEDLPVLFAVRMSLSFPFLFRAVRLYVVRRSGAAAGAQELAEIWLADGGITSNFPIHLFDAPIPGRPTFCLNLLYHDDELELDLGRGAGPKVEARPERPDPGLPIAPAGGAAGTDDLVYMLRTNSGRLSAYTRFAEGTALQRLARFGGRIVSTARQWGDNQLVDVPGYRDRIVHIRMLPDEGGFNFAMGPDKIAALQRRGARAGEVIAARFRPDATRDPLHPGERLELNWANHRFARFRSFLAGLEVTASRFAAAWALDHARAERPAADPRHVFPSIEQMTDEARQRKDPFPQRVGYPFSNDGQADLAHEMVKALVALHRIAGEPAWRGIDFNNGEPTSPRPKAPLKLRPPSATDALAERP